MKRPRSLQSLQRRGRSCASRCDRYDRSSLDVGPMRSRPDDRTRRDPPSGSRRAAVDARPPVSARPRAGRPSKGAATASRSAGKRGGVRTRQQVEPAVATGERRRQRWSARRPSGGRPPSSGSAGAAARGRRRRAPERRSAESVRPRDADGERPGRGGKVAPAKRRDVGRGDRGDATTTGAGAPTRSRDGRDARAPAATATQARDEPSDRRTPGACAPSASASRGRRSADPSHGRPSAADQAAPSPRGPPTSSTRSSRLGGRNADRCADPADGGRRRVLARPRARGAAPPAPAARRSSPTRRASASSSGSRSTGSATTTRRRRSSRPTSSSPTPSSSTRC